MPCKWFMFETLIKRKGGSLPSVTPNPEGQEHPFYLKYPTFPPSEHVLLLVCKKFVRLRLIFCKKGAR